MKTAAAAQDQGAAGRATVAAAIAIAKPLSDATATAHQNGVE